MWRAGTYDQLPRLTIELISRRIGMIIVASSGPAKPKWTTAKYYPRRRQSGVPVSTFERARTLKDK